MGVADSPAEGRTIGDGRYTLLGEIGRGGAGVVWRGIDQRIQRPVAIKEATLPSGISQKERETALSRVRREVRLAGGLNHPATITLYDVLWEHDAIFIIMELVDGSSLADTLALTGPLRPRWAARIALEILGALEVAHNAGIVHRDLKPSNIMLPSSDAPAKLADFGIARMHEDTKLTQTGSVIGSPAYLSPEQINGAPVTPAADLWQLGVVLYCMLHGSSPFVRDSGQSTLYAVLGFSPPRLGCGEALSSAVAALLNKQPQDRPTAAELRPVLEQASATPPEPDQTTTDRHRAPRPGGRWRRPALVTGVALAMVGCFAGGMVFDRVMASRGAAAEQSPPAEIDGSPETLFWDTANNVFALEEGSVDMTRVDFEKTGCVNGNLEPNGALQQTRCDTAHSIEIFASYRLPRTADSSYPVNMSAIAPGFCEAGFASYGTSPWLRGQEIVVTAMAPSTQRWNADSQFRNILYCAARPADGTDFTGSGLTAR